MTISELGDSSKKLANDFTNVEIIKIGKSRAGRILYCLKIGEGKENALLFAFPHPNEPIGIMSLEFLSHFLAENPEFTKHTGYSWHIIKAIDIDGAVLNEGWFKGEFNPLKYAMNYYRPAPYEQVEWTFPINHKKLKFDTPTPETQALMNLMQELKPKFMYSLHNSGFGGVYFYISNGVGNIYEELVNFVKKENLPLHLGEPETPYIKKLHDAIFQIVGVQEMYDFTEAYGIENPQEFIKMGTSSVDYVKRIVNKNCFNLVCEMPYFYHKNIEDTSLTEFKRRELRIKSLEFMKNIAKHSNRVFRRVKKFCNKSTRIYTAVECYSKVLRASLEVDISDAKTSTIYDGRATVSQAFDSNVSSRYYSLLTLSIIVRLCKEAISNHPENEKEIANIKIELENFIEQKIGELLKHIKFEVIPIQKLVRVQIGSAFITLESLTDKLSNNNKD